MTGRSTLRSSTLFSVIKSNQYISTNEQTTDILMKPLSKIKFAYLRDKLGFVEIAPLVEKEEMTSLVGREH
jgi:hypothetical protein